MRGVNLKRVQCVRDLGVKIIYNLYIVPKSFDAVNKVNWILGFVTNILLLDDENVILSTCRCLVGPHLEDAVQCRSPDPSRDVYQLGVQHRAIQMTTSRNKPYNGRLSFVNLSFTKCRHGGKGVKCLNVIFFYECRRMQIIDDQWPVANEIRYR